MGQIAHSDEASRRALLANIHDAAIEAVQGETLIRAHSRLDGNAWIFERGDTRIAWPLDPKGRIFAIGAGKAAASILAGLEAVLGDRLAGGCAIVKHGHTLPLQKVIQFEAGHPTPDQAGVEATAQLLEFVSTLGPQDSLFFAMTGGASALLVAPADGLTLTEKARATDLLMAAGAPISELNLVRKHLSKVKGGRLRDAIDPARSMTLLISDVPGDDPAMVGSGPTFTDTSTPADALAILEHHDLLERVPQSVLTTLRSATAPLSCPRPGQHDHLMLANNRTALDAAQAAAIAAGYAVTIVDANLEGNTHDAARRFAAALREAAPRAVLLAAGETSLKVTGTGKGGRNQEFALVAAQSLEGLPNVTLLASGTDGTDGPTDAAGAFADGTTIARAQAEGLNPVAMLANNDSHNLFAALGDLHVTGPTGTNVMDLIIGVVG